MTPEAVAELLAAAKAALENFHPFITAWEANDPYEGDGEALYERLRAAVASLEEEQ